MHVHVLGICGTFMAGVAAIAREAGHRVTGSDRAVYPPMSDQLEALGIDIIEGFEADQLKTDPDVVVVGNVMTRGMPVVEALLNSGMPYTSGPQWLASEVLNHQRVVAVAGTHGKTTTTSLLAWILDQAGLKPGFLIGGVPADFAVSARLGAGSVFVIEADEYDTAFFDKRAKFLHYGPDTVIINNLEFDHADIYPDLQAIQWQFHQLLRALPGNGRLITRADDENVHALLQMGCWTPVDSFSSSRSSSAQWIGTADHAGVFRLFHNEAEVGQSAWGLTGNHNAENTLAALLAARHLGVDPQLSLQAIAAFKGVKRRLELRGIFSGVSLFDDFAHHPTAIRRTISGLVSMAAGGRVLVVLEPRSNTMKMGVHKSQLAEALRGADRVWVLKPGELDWDLPGALAGLPATIYDNAAAIASDVGAAARPGDRVVVMSNGGFHGIQAMLEHELSGAATGS
jgi:UDP-N-acetylmuramate: L-alanyl-gamma-D-glutamyl-meso-diaminopimelate ligase